MFYGLFLLILLSVHLGWIYDTPHSNKVIKSIEIILLIIVSTLIANYLAVTGLVFNTHRPYDIGIFDTISINYIAFIIGDIIIASIIYFIYWFFNRKIKIATYWFILILMLASIIIYYPGTSSADGDNSYNQFLTHTYLNWQPPMFTIWWNIFHFYGATFLMNMLLYYGGLITISYYLHYNNKRWQNDLLFMFSLNPILFTQLIIVWKDISYTGFLIDAVATYIMLDIIKNKSFRIILWIAFFMVLFLAVGFRANGIIAVIPLLYIANLRIINSTSITKKHIASLSTSILTGALFILINSFIVNHIFKAQDGHMEQFAMLSDTAYINCAATGLVNIDPRFLSDPSTAQDIICNQALNYYNLDALTNDWNNWGTPYKAPLKFDVTAEGLQISKKAWINSIMSHPFTYLSYRGQFFINVLFNQYWYPTGNLNATQDYLNNIAHFQHLDMKYIIPITMLILTLFGIAYCIRNKRYDISLMILVSSILQLLILYFLIPAHAARYFLWNDIGTIIAIALLKTKQTWQN